MRKKDLIRICEKHDDCIFLTFTNGTLIDEAFADEMLRVKNFVPAISLEGFGEATDSRRGKGVYEKVLKAMKILHERKLVYGISCCYTSANYDAITSEEYWDMMIENGAYFVWYFHYMPVGNDASPELLPTPEQRETVYRRIRDYRSRTMPSSSEVASQAAEAICISTRTETQIPACSSTIRTPISGKRACWT